MWSAGTVVLMRFGNIAIMAIVARLVAPDQFGVFALAITAHGMVICLSELGVASAVARADVDLAKVAPTVVSIAVVMSLMLAAVLAAAAEPLANLVRIRLTRRGRCGFSPSVWRLPGRSRYRPRNYNASLEQRRIFLANSVAFGAASVVLVVLSSGSDGAMASRGRLLSGNSCPDILITGSVTHLSARLSENGTATAVRFGLPLAFANLLSQVLLNVDYIFIGRSMSTEDVGFYMLPSTSRDGRSLFSVRRLNGVVIPAFSVSNTSDRLDRKRWVALRRRRSRRLSDWSDDPGSRRSVDPHCYGEKWVAASRAVRLAVYGVLTVFGLLFANVAIAVGRTGILLGVQIAALVLLVPTMAIGIAGSAWSVSGWPTSRLSRRDDSGLPVRDPAIDRYGTLGRDPRNDSRQFRRRRLLEWSPGRQRVVQFANVQLLLGGASVLRCTSS